MAKQKTTTKVFFFFFWLSQSFASVNDVPLYSAKTQIVIGRGAILQGGPGDLGIIAHLQMAKISFPEKMGALKGGLYATEVLAIFRLHLQNLQEFFNLGLAVLTLFPCWQPAGSWQLQEFIGALIPSKSWDKSGAFRIGKNVTVKTYQGLFYMYRKTSQISVKTWHCLAFCNDQA